MGAFDKDGYFMVVEEQRRSGRTDRAGYLLDKTGKRFVDLQKKERIRKRAIQSQQADEFYRIDANGDKIQGRYEKGGVFKVVVNDRAPGRTDNEGYLVDERGVRIVDEVIRERLRLRAELRPQEDEFVAIDHEGEKVTGRYTRQGHFIVEERQRL